jgi:hypothetical protein
LLRRHGDEIDDQKLSLGKACALYEGNMLQSLPLAPCQRAGRNCSGDIYGISAYKRQQCPAKRAKRVNVL